MSGKAIYVQEDTYHFIKKTARLEKRSISKQTEHWIDLLKIMRSNPTLPLEMIEGTLLAKQQFEEGDFDEMRIKA